MRLPNAFCIVLFLAFFMMFHSIGMAYECQAYIGQDFGVGKLIIHDYGIPVRWILFEENGRVFYPVLITESLPLPWEKEARQQESYTAYYFLFRGKEDFKITIVDNQQRYSSYEYYDRKIYDVHPTENELLYTLLLKDWWRNYVRFIQKSLNGDQYSSVVENYLLYTLSRRLNLPIPEMYNPYYWTGNHDIEDMVGFFTGAESVKCALQQHVILQDTKIEPADQPMPKPALPPAVELPPFDQNVEVEPIAFHIPEECWYIRCGSFANFQWLRKTLDDWGGNLRDMVSFRGIDYAINKKIETQLSIQETELGKLFGGMLISDVAALGSDMFIKEGGTFGLMFEAKNNAWLSLQLNKQRLQTKEKFPNATLETIDIGGKQVSFLSTPDNQVRSFYVIDGNYHLITNSKYIVQRFLEAGQKKSDLGSSNEFRYARTLHPVSNKDQLFLYLSDPFFRMIVSPHYRVEMTRRMKAEMAIINAQLALLMAQSEKAEVTTIADLCEKGYLPTNFNQRVESGTFEIRDGVVVDTLRGRATLLTPILDMEIAQITKSEAEAYDRFVEIYNQAWRRMDPTFVALKQLPSDNGKEKISLDVHIFPYALQKYGNLANLVDEPDGVGLIPAADARFSLQVQISSKLLQNASMFSDQTKSAHLSLSILDMDIPFNWENGFPIPERIQENEYWAYAMIPDWVIQILNERDQTPIQTDSEGMEYITPRSDMPIWLKKYEGYYACALHRPTLVKVAPQLKVVDDARKAQIRFDIRSLADTKMRKYFDAVAYASSYHVTHGNIYFMDRLINQLHIPTQNARDVAEQILYGKLVSPLGGTYELRNSYYDYYSYEQEPSNTNDAVNPPAPPKEDGKKVWTWTSDLDNPVYNKVPGNYKCSFLDWFQGLHIDFSLDEQTLSTHIELEVMPKQ